MVILMYPLIGKSFLCGHYSLILFSKFMKHIIFTFLLSVAFFFNATASGLDRTGWTATVSENWPQESKNRTPSMFDDDLTTDWSSVSVLKPGEWMIIDMKSKQAFNQIVMDQTMKPGDHPEGFDVYVSDDSENWGEAIATGKGTNGQETKITFPEKAGRYIKIQLTEEKGAYWAVTELYVNLVDTRATWTATICDRLLDAYPSSGDLPNMFDGNPDTEWSSTAELKDGDWMIIDMKAERTFNQIIFDQTKTPGDCPNDFAVYVSNDGENWGEKITSGKGTSGPQTAIVFFEQTAQYIKIELGERGAYWKVTELYVNLIELDYRFSWTATICDRLQDAYPSSGDLPNMFDGNLDTEWSSTAELKDGDWMIIDMKAERTFNQIIFDQTKTPGDCPDDFAVYVSNDGENWGDAVAEGKGTSGSQTAIIFLEQTARYIKIELGQRSAYWKVTEFHTNLVKLDYRFGWTASISSRLLNSDKLGLMFDNDLTTNWEAGDVEPGDWLVVDMKAEQTFNQIVLDQSVTPGDKLNSFKVYVSDDPENWGEPVFEGKGTDGKTIITFAEEQTGRYIKIEATESTNKMWWKITEFHVQTVELDYRFGWTAIAFNRPEGGIPAMFDGEITSGWSTEALQVPGQWVIINMQEPQTFNQIVLGLNNSRYGDYPRGYEVYVSNDPENFGNVLVSGIGTEGAETKIDFLDQEAQYIKIVQTGTAEGSYWAIDEFHINTVTDRDYRYGWTATVSEGWNTSRLPNMFDNNLDTDWSSEAVLDAGQWMIVDMKKAQTFNLIAFDQTKNNGDCPEGFKVFVSNDGTNWGDAVAEGKGTNAPHTLITFKEQTARYVKIELTEAKGAYWAVTELHVKTGDYRYGWTATVSERLSSSNLPNMFDGNLATDWSTLAELRPGDWMIVDMKTAQTFNQIIFDQTTNNGDYPNGFTVYASNDLENFGEAVTIGGGVNAPQTKTNIALDQTARYIKIELTESKGAYWAVTEFHINLVTDKEDYRWGWTMTASHNNGRAMSALDGNLDTKWDSGPMYGEEWIILDMKEAIEFNQVILENSGDYPREYEVYTSNDGTNWGEVVKSGFGEDAQNEFGQTEIVLPTQNARYLKINQLGLGFGIYWSIFEIYIDYDPALSVVQPSTDNIQAYYSNGQIHLQGVSLPNVLNIYNLLGQKLKSMEVNQDVISVDLGAGVYIITLDNNAFSYKLLVK